MRGLTFSPLDCVHSGFVMSTLICASSLLEMKCLKAKTHKSKMHEKIWDIRDPYKKLYKKFPDTTKQSLCVGLGLRMLDLLHLCWSQSNNVSLLNVVCVATGLAIAVPIRKNILDVFLRGSYLIFALLHQSCKVLHVRSVCLQTTFLRLNSNRKKKNMHKQTHETHTMLLRHCNPGRRRRHEARDSLWWLWLHNQEGLDHKKERWQGDDKEWWQDWVCTQVQHQERWQGCWKWSSSDCTAPVAFSRDVWVRTNSTYKDAKRGVVRALLVLPPSRQVVPGIYIAIGSKILNSSISS